VPKRGFEALAEACAPVIVVADRPAAGYTPGESVALDVHVVSDLRVALDDGVVTAQLSWAGGHREWRWAGAVPADGCVRVGTVEVETPDAPGPITLDLTFESGERKVSNRYEAVISRGT
jgi:hypothetical protein